MYKIIALALLVSDISPEPFNNPQIRGAISKIAIQQELMDPREISHIMARGPEFEVDLKLLRERYKDLKDAPSIADAELLPHMDALTEGVAFNHRYIEYMSQKRDMEIWRSHLYDVVIQEARILEYIYNLAKDGRAKHYYVTVRRRAMKSLVEKIGYTNFYRGNFPPCAPTWRFTQIE